MLQIEISNSSIEEYFKAPKTIENFLQKAVSLDLLAIVDSIENDKLHQKSLNDIEEDKLHFYNDSKKLIDAINT
ncbi:MAG: hypothetical protein DRG30_11015 [Epsilonproteobacteria bacterium]|nr:MAG: hypothetical protein DRG30_11015 [Campylobacterota bacterium]